MAGKGVHTSPAVLQAVLRGSGVGGVEGEQSITQALLVEARFATVRLLGSLLQASPGFQVRAVRTWETVNAIFGLLHDDMMRHDALRMVGILPKFMVLDLGVCLLIKDCG
jgi:hypothetical protein